LSVSVEEKTILKGITLSIQEGEIHAIMGPNGSGKSTLCQALMGHPKYKIDHGSVTMNGLDLLSLPVDERARKGLFLGFQYPQAIPGISVANFLRSAVSARRGYSGKARDNGRDSEKETLIPVREFLKELKDSMNKLGFSQSFISRHINDGFSGGEKKRMEILQMAMLKPEYAVLDETDSGLDIDALRLVADGINKLLNPNLGILLITHYQRLLDYIKPNYVHVLVDGNIVLSGCPELALELEAKGYDWVKLHENS
jgi:Fe-S cluster assembly ATP-binding protein